MREYLQRHPDAEAAVIKLFRAVQQRGFHDGDQLRQRTARGCEGRSSLCAGLLTAYQESAAVHGASLAARVRQARRHVTAEDFPASWSLGESALQSHESGDDYRKFDCGWMR